MTECIPDCTVLAAMLPVPESCKVCLQFANRKKSENTFEAAEKQQAPQRSMSQWRRTQTMLKTATHSFVKKNDCTVVVEGDHSHLRWPTLTGNCNTQAFNTESSCNNFCPFCIEVFFSLLGISGQHKCFCDLHSASLQIAKHTKS